MFDAAVLTRLLPRSSGPVGSVARGYWTSVRNRDPRTLTLTGLVVAFVLDVIAFADLVEDYLTGDPIVRWDVHFATWLHVHASQPLVRVFEVVTYAGNAAVLGLVVLTAAVVLFRRNKINEAALLIVAFGGAVVLNGLLKLVFHRSRPELAFVHLDTYSFPSGHAAVSAATFTAAAWLLGLRYRTWRARLLVGLATLAAVAVVGFSRLYLGAHYLSDVLAGISFGVAWATLCLIGYAFLDGRDVRNFTTTAVQAPR
jgi:membrane-associated phospholipid phosphatase